MRTGLSVLLFCLIFFFLFQFGILYTVTKYMHKHLTYVPREDLIDGKQIHVYPHTGTYHRHPFFIKYERPNAFRNPDLGAERDAKIERFERSLHTVGGN